MPVILLFCIVGSFANQQFPVFGVVLMLAFGLIACAMEENGFPVGTGDSSAWCSARCWRTVHPRDDPWRWRAGPFRAATDRRRARYRWSWSCSRWPVRSGLLEKTMMRLLFVALALGARCCAGQDRQAGPARGRLRRRRLSGPRRAHMIGGAALARALASRCWSNKPRRLRASRDRSGARGARRRHGRCSSLRAPLVVTPPHRTPRSTAQRDRLGGAPRRRAAGACRTDVGRAQWTEYVSCLLKRTRTRRSSRARASAAWRPSSAWCSP